MARKRSNRRFNRVKVKTSKKRSRYSPLQKLAFQMGRVSLGLKGDTKIADSYNAGATRPQPKEKKAKKPMY